MRRLRAIGDKVFIIPLSEQKQLDCGLFLPGYKYETYCVGDVFSVNHPDLPPGTRVFYKRFGLQEVEVDGCKFHVTRVSEIVALGGS